MVCAVLSACLLGASGTACSVKSTAWVHETGARQLRLSDRQEPMTKVQLVQGSGYYLDPGRDDQADAYGPSQPYLLVDVGALNPVLAVSNKDLAAMDHPDMPFGSGEWALQVSLPIAFHLWWDAFSDNNPILNTDYTFGGDVALRRSFGDAGELRLGAYVGHISTHLGDEYVIAASADRGPQPFDRVNVSYWPMRARAGWTMSNTRFDGDSRTKWLVGLIGEVERTNRDRHDFYYSLFPGEADPARVPLVQTRTEGSATLDWRYYFGTGVGSGSGDASVARHLRAAVTVASRAVFPYHNALTSAENHWSMDAVTGYAFPGRLKIGGRQAMAYLRYYRGPNPHGQFRNQTAISQAGLGLAIVH